MIAEVLNRTFVLGLMRKALADLESPDDRRAETVPPIAAKLEEGDLDFAREELAAALQREERQTSGQVCRQLVYRGWRLAGCSIATFHPDLIASLPRWRALEGEA